MITADIKGYFRRLKINWFNKDLNELERLMLIEVEKALYDYLLKEYTMEIAKKGMDNINANQYSICRSGSEIIKIVQSTENGKKRYKIAFKNNDNYIGERILGLLNVYGMINPIYEEEGMFLLDTEFRISFNNLTKVIDFQKKEQEEQYQKIDAILSKWQIVIIGIIGGLTSKIGELLLTKIIQLFQ